MRLTTFVATLLLSASIGHAQQGSEISPPPQPTTKFTFYGLLKLDAAYDSCRTDPGNFVRWVDLEADEPRDDAFSMTANQSRLGLDISATKTERAETNGRIEIDFYGGGAENKSRPMLRHAYFKVAWPKSGMSLVAGQTSDVFSPLNPRTLNYSVAWWAGNIGYRRPQIRVNKTTQIGEGAKLQISGAITRTIGDTTSDFVPIDAGQDSGVPGLQGRAGLELPGKNGGSSVGLSGHFAQEEFDISAEDEHRTFDSWSANLDWSHAVGRRLTLQGELFSGANLAAYLGGIGQGVNLERGIEIGSTGGWLAADLEPSDNLDLRLGASVDDPDDADLEAGERTLNRSIFGTAVYAISREARLGVELSYWTTAYKDNDQVSSFRTQLSFFYSF